MEQTTALRYGRLGILGVLIFNTVMQPLLVMIVIPDARTRLALIAMAVLVLNPLIVFYLRNNWPGRICTISIVSIMILWFFTLPLFHELSHVIGLYVIGSKPTAYQLVPKFWEGDFSTAWVRSQPVNDWRNPIPGLFPYIKDVFLLIIGFITLKGEKVSNAFWAGFIYTFFCLGSLFDIVNNYFQKIIGYVAGNDFYGVTLGWGEAWSNIVGVAFSIFAVCICAWVLMDHQSPNGVRKFRLWENGK